MRFYLFLTAFAASLLAAPVENGQNLAQEAQAVLDGPINTSWRPPKTDGTVPSGEEQVKIITSIWNKVSSGDHTAALKIVNNQKKQTTSKNWHRVHMLALANLTGTVIRL